MSMRNKQRAVGMLFLGAVGVGGCFAEPPSTDAASSTGGRGSTGGGTTDVAAETTEQGSTEVDSVGTSSTDGTSPGSTTLAESGSTGGSSSSSGGPGDTSTTSGVERPLCPLFIDEFDGRDVHGVWESEHGLHIEQVGGATVISLTAQPGDAYPRRMIPWSSLGVVAGQAVSFSVQPVATPVVAGTQLNLVLEGAGEGNNVTLSLNNPQGQLQYRITSNVANVEDVELEQDAVFPSGASLLAVISDSEVTLATLSADGTVVQELASVTVPFDIQTSRVGFAANNYAMLDEPTQLSAESFSIACE